MAGEVRSAGLEGNRGSAPAAPGWATPAAVAGALGIAAPSGVTPGVLDAQVGLAAPDGTTGGGAGELAAPLGLGAAAGFVAPAAETLGSLAGAVGSDATDATAGQRFPEPGGISPTAWPTLGGVNDALDQPAAGIRTVSFPSPPAEADEQGVPGEPATATAAASEQRAPAAPDPDELYEHVLDRLRHELLAERERLGSLIPELPE